MAASAKNGSATLASSIARISALGSPLPSGCQASLGQHGQREHGRGDGAGMDEELGARHTRARSAVGVRIAREQRGLVEREHSDQTAERRRTTAGCAWRRSAGPGRSGTPTRTSSRRTAARPEGIATRSAARSAAISRGAGSATAVGSDSGSMDLPVRARHDACRAPRSARTPAGPSLGPPDGLRSPSARCAKLAARCAWAASPASLRVSGLLRAPYPAARGARFQIALLEERMSLQLGDVAPDFEADSTEGRINFHDWIGKRWACSSPIPRTTRRSARPNSASVAAQARVREAQREGDRPVASTRSSRPPEVGRRTSRRRRARR